MRVTAAMCALGRVISEPRLSPDGETVAYVVTAGGRASVVLVAAAGGPEVVLTTSPEPPRSASYGGGVFDWTPSGDAVVYVGTDGLLYHQPVIGGPPRTVVTDGPVTAPAVSPDGTRVAYVRDGRAVAVAWLTPGGPWPVRLTPGDAGPAGPGGRQQSPAGPGGRSPDFAFDPAWSPDSRWVAWQQWDVPAMAWDDSVVVVARADGSAPPTPVQVTRPAAMTQPRFSPDGSVLAFLCDAGGWLNLWRAAPDGTGAGPMLSDTAEHGGPTWGPGERSYAWSPGGGQVAFCRNEDGFGRLCLLDVERGDLMSVARGVHLGLSWAGPHLAAIRSGARTPNHVIVADPAEQFEAVDPPRRTVARGPVAGFEAAGLVEPEPVEWNAEDLPGVGPVVHGRLYRTQVAGEAPPPLLVWVHGGPTGQNQVVFNPRVAFFCDRGFNVLQVDYRGSTGWGRAYTQALRGRWGQLDVDDTAAGMAVAGERGWGDPRRMVPIGSSGGGLTVVLLLARHPELCAAGVELYGVADLFDLDETTHRFEAHYLQSIVGPLPEAAGRYRDGSPITAAARVTVPLLVLQGSADRVVPRVQSDALVACIRDAGGSVEYHVYEGEGHGWNTPEVVEDELERIWAFLRRVVLRRR